MSCQPSLCYEDFEVHTEWVHETAEDTLIAHLPGFKKEQMKIQVTASGNLRISGERPIGDNEFSHFSKNNSIPSIYDHDKIRGNCKGGVLHVKCPKLNVPTDEKPKSDQRPEDVPEKQSNGVEQANQESPPKAKEADKVPEQTPDKPSEVEDKSNASNEYERLKEKDKNGLDQREKSSEKPADSAQQADKYYQLGVNYQQVLAYKYDYVSWELLELFV